MLNSLREPERIGAPGGIDRLNGRTRPRVTRVERSIVRRLYCSGGHCVRGHGQATCGSERREAVGVFIDGKKPQLVRGQGSIACNDISEALVVNLVPWHRSPDATAAHVPNTRVSGFEGC